jgi:adenylate cyclase
LTKGEIYRYVGDEVVVTWSMKNGLNNSNWIRTYFHIKNEIEQLKEKYLSEYNFVPEFTSSFHCGEVVLGEIGDVKSQIVFHGEPLYTTALVEKQCTSINKQVLATSILINLTSLPPIYSAKRVGRLKKDSTLDLYTIFEIALKAL